MINGRVVVHDEIVRQKLLMAAPHIIENNEKMVTAMLEYIKPTVVAQTPLGPGHFGYHLRDNYRIEVGLKGPVVVSGTLKAPVQGYWREYGTLGRSRGRVRARAAKLLPSMWGKQTAARQLASFGGHGERAFLTAHHALGATRQMINLFYGGMAKWWRA